MLVGIVHDEAAAAAILLLIYIANFDSRVRWSKIDHSRQFLSIFPDETARKGTYPQALETSYTDEKKNQRKGICILLEMMG